MLLWILAPGWAADCDDASTEDCACASERARTVASALADTPPGPWRASELPWRAMAAQTCEWADRLSPGAGGSCGRATACVRLHGEDRLSTLSAAALSARALDLARVTGRWGCDPADGRDCVDQARDAEDERLMTVVSALADAGAPMVDPQRLWFSYRDSGCEAESATAPQTSADWARAACSAVLAQRRTELLSLLASTDPAVGPLVEDARFHAAEHAAPGGRPWQRWLDEVGQVPEVWRILREVLEARADGAVLPELTRTEAYTRCEEPQSAECAAAIRAETGAVREVEVGAASVPEAQLRAERIWRSKWCGSLQGMEASRCEAAIDWVVIAAVKGAPLP